MRQRDIHIIGRVGKDWTEWSTNEAKESNTSKVETRTAYRYRAKMKDVEDNSGKSYTVSGTLDKELAGKQATLLVYKNDEPSDSNNEYVGQVAIGEDGSYAYTFIPRQAISAKTGDYTVALAIEGAENPVFLEKILLQSRNIRLPLRMMKEISLIHRR